MPKVTVKDIIMFLKTFGISSLFFISGIIVSLIGEKKLGIEWPAYVIIAAMLIFSGIIVLIIETIKCIKTNNEVKQEDITEKIKREDGN